MRRFLILLAVLLAIAIFWDGESQAPPWDGDFLSGSSEAEGLEFAQPQSGKANVPTAAREGISEDTELQHSKELPEDFPDFPEDDSEIVDAPLDPIQVGDCGLIIEFVDAKTGELLSGRVDLWRLNAPGNKDWSAGDQLQASAEVKEGRHEFVQVPAGKYRAYPLFARAESKTPAAFEVKGNLTYVVQRVEMPQKEQVQLQLYRSDGLLYSGDAMTVEMNNLGAREFAESKLKPSWIAHRNLKGDGLYLFEEGNPFFGNSSANWKSLIAGPNGFQLWEAQQASRASAKKYRIEIRVNQSHPNLMNLQPSGSGTYVGIFVDPAELQALLVFPSELGAQDLSKEFQVSCTAISIGAESGRTLASAWSDLAVRIQLQTPDIQPVDFIWHPASGPLPKIWLRGLQ